MGRAVAGGGYFEGMGKGEDLSEEVARWPLLLGAGGVFFFASSHVLFFSVYAAMMH